MADSWESRRRIRMRRGYRRVSGVLVVMAILAVSACGEATSDRGTPETTRAVPDPAQAGPDTTRAGPDTTRAAADRDEVVGPSEPEDLFRSPVSYLEEVIPPCVPLLGGSHDPCARTRPHQVAVLSAPAAPPLWPHTDDLPTWSSPCWPDISTVSAFCLRQWDCALGRSPVGRETTEEKVLG